ncbi:hypothetical protein [Nonomuraea maheshkhaliensis]
MSDCVVELMPADPDGWDHWFSSPQEAETARDRAGRSNFHVLGVGFAAADAPALVADIADRGWDGSLNERVDRRETFPGPGERRLGFELVGFDVGTWHAWSCVDLVTVVRQAVGVRPGPDGLIQDEQDAHRAARWLTSSGLGDPKVFLWAAALLTEPSVGAPPGG